MTYINDSLTFLSPDDLKQKDEKSQRLQNDLRHLLESLAITLSTPARFVESEESCIKERIRDLLHDVKEKCMVSSIPFRGKNEG
jgi:hypothetical protein